jgi:hypothetical protein
MGARRARWHVECSSWFCHVHEPGLEQRRALGLGLARLALQAGLPLHNVASARGDVGRFGDLIARPTRTAHRSPQDADRRPRETPLPPLVPRTIENHVDGYVACRLLLLSFAKARSDDDEDDR